MKAFKFAVYSLFIIPYSLFLGGCNVINPSEQVPSYLSVQPFTVRTDSLKQGSNSSHITDVWVSIDGVNQGAYQLPAKFPLLYEGNHHVSLRPGIMLNGIAATRAVYTILNSFDTIINLQAGKVIPVNPVTTYYATCHFQFKENFDYQSDGFKTSTNSDTIMDTIPPGNANAFEGRSGVFYLDDNRPVFQCETKDSFYLPGAYQPCYVELNYKCDNEFSVGTIAYSPSAGVLENELLIVNPTDVWKKIYVDLTPQVTSILDASAWKIYFYATKSNGASTATIYLDNIKVVY